MGEKLNSSIGALALATQLVSAEPNEELANSLKDQKSELSIQTSGKVKQVKDDVNKTVANNYLTNIKTYGVGEKSQDNIYNGVGLAVEGSNGKLVIEKGQDFTKVGGVGKYDLQSGVYMKGGAAYLSKKLDVSGDKYNVGQSTLGAGVGVGNDSYNLEAGHLVSGINVSGIDGVNTTAHRTYLEGAMRNKGSLGQLDLTGELKKTTLYGEQTNSYKVTAEYYPTNDVQVGVSQTSESIKTGDFRLIAGVKYTFGNGKWNPYLEAGKNMGEHTSAKLVYEAGIAQKPLSMKNTFEDAALSSNLVDEGKIAEKIQNRKNELAQANSNEVVNNPTWANISTQTTTDNGTGTITNIDVSSYLSNATGGTYSATGLPAGVSIDATTGIISGNYDAGNDLGASRHAPYNEFNVKIIYTKGRTQYPSNTFTLRIRDDG